MEELVKVKVEPLDAKAFAPYGQVLMNASQMLFPEVEAGEGRVAIELRRYKRGSNFRCEQLAIHFSYNQTFIPLKGSLILIVAPAPSNRTEKQENYALDYRKVKAFEIKPGQAALIERGVWHFIKMLDDEVTLINITRKNADEGPTAETQHVEQVPRNRPYVEFVDLAERDNRVIELEL